MDYDALASELMQKMQTVQKLKRQKNIRDVVHGEAFVLNYIFFKGCDVVPGDLSCATGVSSARVAVTLNSLEDKGLVVREIDKSDRRRIIVRLTEKGEETVKEHKTKILRGVTEMLRLLGEHDAKEYVRITSKLAEILPEIDI